MQWLCGLNDVMLRPTSSRYDKRNEFIGESFDVFQVRQKTRKRRLKKWLLRSAYEISKICSNKSKSTLCGTVLPVPKKTGCRKQKWTDTTDTIPIPGNYIGFRRFHDSTNIIYTIILISCVKKKLINAKTQNVFSKVKLNLTNRTALKFELKVITNTFIGNSRSYLPKHKISTFNTFNDQHDLYACIVLLSNVVVANITCRYYTYAVSVVHSKYLNSTQNVRLKQYNTLYSRWFLFVIKYVLVTARWQHHYIVSVALIMQHGYYTTNNGSQPT